MRCHFNLIYYIPVLYSQKPLCFGDSVFIYEFFIFVFAVGLEKEEKIRNIVILYILLEVKLREFEQF